MDRLLSPAPPQRPHARPTATNALWGHILRKTGSSQVPPSTATSTSTFGKHSSAIAPIDKAGASTRILLHDTQAHLERFADRVSELVTDLDGAKRELLGVQKLYVEDHEQLVDKMIGLANRSQTELQKSIGSPAQSPQVRDLAKDISHLASRVVAMERTIDSLHVLNQTQLQALQTIQDQQGQILTTIGPLLSLIQAMPLHVENARNHVREAVADLRQEVLSSMATTKSSAAGSANDAPVVSGTSRANSTALSPSDDTRVSQQRKKRRLESLLERPLSSTTAWREQPQVTPLGKRPSHSLTRTVQRSLAAAQLPPKTPGGSFVHSAALPIPQMASPTPARPLLPRTLINDQTGRNCTPSTLRSGNTLWGRSTPLPLNRLASPSHTIGPLSDIPDSLSGDLERSTSSVNEPNSACAADHELSAVASENLAYKLRTPTNSYRASAGSPALSCDAPPRTPRVGITSDGAHASVMPPPSVGKPMSLKDRRAMLADEYKNTGGKRFIPLDDDEDDVEALATM